MVAKKIFSIIFLGFFSVVFCFGQLGDSSYKLRQNGSLLEAWSIFGDSIKEVYRGGIDFSSELKVYCFFGNLVSSGSSGGSIHYDSMGFWWKNDLCIGGIEVKDDMVLFRDAKDVEECTFDDMVGIDFSDAFHRDIWNKLKKYYEKEYRIYLPKGYYDNSSYLHVDVKYYDTECLMGKNEYICGSYMPALGSVQDNTVTIYGGSILKVDINSSEEEYSNFQPYMKELDLDGYYWYAYICTFAHEMFHFMGYSDHSHTIDIMNGPYTTLSLSEDMVSSAAFFLPGKEMVLFRYHLHHSLWKELLEDDGIEDVDAYINNLKYVRSVEKKRYNIKSCYVGSFNDTHMKDTVGLFLWDIKQTEKIFFIK